MLLISSRYAIIHELRFDSIVKEIFFMRVIVTVYGLDRVGIIYGVCKLLAEANINILDISQTVMQEFFTMTMLADMSAASEDLVTVREKLNQLAKELCVTIRIQSEDLFTAMHTV